MGSLNPGTKRIYQTPKRGPQRHSLAEKTKTGRYEIKKKKHEQVCVLCSKILRVFPLCLFIHLCRNTITKSWLYLNFRLDMLWKVAVSTVLPYYRAINVIHSGPGYYVRCTKPRPSDENFVGMYQKCHNKSSGVVLLFMLYIDFTCTCSHVSKKMMLKTVNLKMERLFLTPKSIS